MTRSKKRLISYVTHERVASRHRVWLFRSDEIGFVTLLMCQCVPFFFFSRRIERVRIVTFACLSILIRLRWFLLFTLHRFPVSDRENYRDDSIRFGKWTEIASIFIEISVLINKMKQESNTYANFEIYKSMIRGWNFIENITNIKMQLQN